MHSQWHSESRNHHRVKRNSGTTIGIRDTMNARLGTERRLRSKAQFGVFSYTELPSSINIYVTTTIAIENTFLGLARSQTGYTKFPLSIHFERFLLTSGDSEMRERVAECVDMATQAPR